MTHRFDTILIPLIPTLIDVSVLFQITPSACLASRVPCCPLASIASRHKMHYRSLYPENSDRYAESRLRLCRPRPYYRRRIRSADVDWQYVQSASAEAHCSCYYCRCSYQTGEFGVAVGKHLE